MAGMSSQVFNLVVMIGSIQVAKYIPFEDPFILNSARGIYLGTNVLIVLIYLYIMSQINSKKDMTTLKYVEPAPVGSSEEGKLVTTTINAYDNQQVRAAFRSQLMGVAMVAFMHGYMKYTNPLIVQSILPLKNAIDSNLAKIYIFGYPASGDLKRPFKQAGGLMAAMQQGSVETDKKAIEAAERAGRGGAKEE